MLAPRDGWTSNTRGVRPVRAGYSSRIDSVRRPTASRRTSVIVQPPNRRRSDAGRGRQERPRRSRRGRRARGCSPRTGRAARRGSRFSSCPTDEVAGVEGGHGSEYAIVLARRRGVPFVQRRSRSPRGVQHLQSHVAKAIRRQDRPVRTVSHCAALVVGRTLEPSRRSGVGHDEGHVSGGAARRGAPATCNRATTPRRLAERRGELIHQPARHADVLVLGALSDAGERHPIDRRLGAARNASADASSSAAELASPDPCGRSDSSTPRKPRTGRPASAIDQAVPAT